MLVFSTQLCELLPLYPSLWLALPPSPTPIHVCLSIQYTRIQCVSGGLGAHRNGGGLRQINTWRKGPFTGKFFR
jgi:hypothetical protein